MSYTLSELREELAGTAGLSGLEINSKKLDKLINAAARELLSVSDFQSSFIEARIKVYDPYIVLPPTLGKIKHAAVDGEPVEMRSPWFEYVQHSTGPIADNERVNLVLQRNRTPVFRNLPVDGNEWKMKIVAKLDERVVADDPDNCCGGDDGVEPIINIRGYDGDSIVYSTDAEGKNIRGEDLPISSNAGFTYTGNINFTRIESFSKPTTRGQIELYGVSGTTEHLLAIYEPYERTPMYKSYTFPGIEKCKEQTIYVRAKKEYIPMIHENDICTFGDLEAIRTMMIAQVHRENQHLENYLSWRETARNIQGDVEASDENDKIPPIDVAEGFGNGPSDVAEVY